MNISLVELAVMALATWQAVEVWRHSDLFAGWRAAAENGDNVISRVLACPFCLSVWVGGATGLVILAPYPSPVDPGTAALGALAVLGVATYAVLALVLACAAWDTDVVDALAEEKGETRATVRRHAVAGVAAIGVIVGGVLWLICSRLTWDGTWFALAWGLKLAALGLAVSRLANLGNDLAHDYCRTPHPELPVPEEEDEVVSTNKIGEENDHQAGSNSGGDPAEGGPPGSDYPRPYDG